MAEITQEQKFRFRLRLEREREMAQSATQSEPVAPVEAPNTGNMSALLQNSGGGLLDKFKGAVSNLGKLGPGGVAPIAGAEMLRRGTEKIDEAAYSAGEAVTDTLTSPGPQLISGRTQNPLSQAGPTASADVAAGAGLAANVGVQAIPMFVGGQWMKGLAPGFKRMGEQLMSSALKPPKAARKLAMQTGSPTTQSVNTMLEKGYNVTPGGVENLRAEIGVLNDEISKLVNDSTASIRKRGAAKQAAQILKRLMNQVTPQTDLAAARKALREFLDHPLIKRDKLISVKTAQEMKVGTYRELGGKSYGELKGADVETQKSLARALKDKISEMMPGIAKLNAEESKLLDAEAQVLSRVLVDANKNPMGLGWLAMHPETWLGFAADRSPLIKSLLARAAYSGREQIPSTVGKVVGAGFGSVTANQNLSP